MAKTIKLAHNLHWVGVMDPDLRIFDIVMETSHGTSYNSYLVMAEKTALIDGVKNHFHSEHVEKIKSLVDLETISYLVVNHCEPDHAGSIRDFLDVAPQVQIVGSKAAGIFLKQIINRDFNFLEVKEGDVLDLGGKTLRFIMAPFLHWPDTIFTYAVEDGILMSADAFGSHYCDERMFNDVVGDFSEEFRYYYEIIMSPFKQHVLNAVSKIPPLNVKMIAPSHGPILREKPMQYVDLYEKWSKMEPHSKEQTVLILFVSAYGFTRQLAYALGERLQAGQNIRVETIDVSLADLPMLKEKIDAADMLLVGSPTFNQDALKPIWDVLTVVSPLINKGKPAGAFGSYGWSGEAVKQLEDRLRGLKLKVIEPGLRVQFALSPQKSEDLDRFAAQLLAALSPKL